MVDRGKTLSHNHTVSAEWNCNEGSVFSSHSRTSRTSLSNLARRSLSLFLPDKNLKTRDVAWVMLSDVVGTSVLTFGGVAATLGWALTTSFICGLFPMSLFVSFLMVRTRELVLRNSGLTRVASMGQVATVMAGKRAGTCIDVFVYGYTILGNSSYLLALGNSLQMVGYDRDICLAFAVLVGCVTMLPGIMSIRRLGDSSVLCFCNTLIITAAVVIALYDLAREGRPSCVETFVVEPNLSLFAALGAATNVVYAYAGQWMYFEIMDEMESPSEFPHAFAIAGPFMVITYMCVAGFAYYYGGDQAYPEILEGMARTGLLRVAAFLLFLHVMIVYLLKNLVIVRYLHGTCKPGGEEERTWGSYGRHSMWGFFLLVIGFLVSNSIPFFELLMGLIGGLLGGPINFLIPIFLYLIALTKYSDPSGSDPARALLSKDKGGGSGNGRPFTFRGLVRALSSQPWWEVVTLVIIVAFIIMTMVIGTTQVISRIVDRTSTMGLPFACHALEPHKRPCNGTA